MPEIITFEEALALSRVYKKRHLLLGNGFSIAYKHDIFTYRSLLEEADFTGIPEVRRVFDALDTVDFEMIIRTLQESAKLLSVYGANPGLQKKIEDHSEQLKTLLVQTIAGKHPEGPFDVQEEQYQNVRKFLSHFIGENAEGNIYTLNYDLLLYWAVMHEESEMPIVLEKSDGFGKEDGNEDADYVIWHGETNAHSQRLHYLHGALHLFDAGKELKKFTWINTGKRLIEQARQAMDEGMYPLFVAEGNSEQKLTKIKHSGFLYHSFKSFTTMMSTGTHCLFVYGHSLAANDMHILHKIASGKVPQVFISIYGDVNSSTNKAIVATANYLIEERARLNVKHPLSVTYYDAETANVWDE